jgi:hypothetical protein
MRLCHVFSQLKIPNLNDKETMQNQQFIKLLSNPEIISFLSQNELSLDKERLRQKIKNLIYFHKIPSLKRNENFEFNKNRFKSNKINDHFKIFPMTCGTSNPSDKMDQNKNTSELGKDPFSIEGKTIHASSNTNYLSKISKTNKIIKISKPVKKSPLHRAYSSINSKIPFDKSCVTDHNAPTVSSFNTNTKSRNNCNPINNLKSSIENNPQIKTMKTQFNSVLIKNVRKTDTNYIENSLINIKTNENIKSTNPSELMSITNKDTDINNKKDFRKLRYFAQEQLSEKHLLSDKAIRDIKKHYMKKKKALDVIRKADKIVIIKEKDFYEKESLNRRCHTANEIINLGERERIRNLYDTQYKFKSSKQLKIVSSCHKQFKRNKMIFKRNINKKEKLDSNLEERYRKAVEGSNYKITKSVNKIVVENYKKMNVEIKV